MSVTHLRLGASAVKSWASVLGAGVRVGSTCVVVGVNTPDSTSPDTALQAHFTHGLGHRIAASMFQIVALFERLGDLGAAVNAV